MFSKPFLIGPKILVLFFMGLLCLPLISCGPPNSERIVEGEIHGRKFYVPYLYFVLPSFYISANQIYIRALHPKFEPMTIDKRTLYRQKRQKYLITIMFERPPKVISADASFRSMNEIYHVDTVVGEEYGLIHMAQSEEMYAHNHDIWLEKIDGEIVSYITCTESYQANVPQCRYRSTEGDYRLNFRFNKLMLPEWRAIRDNVLSLIDSFETPEKAKAFLDQAMIDENNLNGE